MFDLINIFDVFLPQLLLYPNPADPLNPDAANMHNKNQEKYKEKVIKLLSLRMTLLVQVRDYVKKYASPDNFEKQQTTLENGDAKQLAAGTHTHKNGHHKKADDGDHSDASELSQTSDIEPIDDEDGEDQDMHVGSDEEEKQQEQDVQ